tara:strand:+ start:243102 stop:244094 length:993 start_codon:yes stop_codon:yes gene_type:complete
MFLNKFNVSTFVVTSSALAVSAATSSLFAYACFGFAIVGATILGIRHFQSLRARQADNDAAIPSNGEGLKNMFIHTLQTRNALLGMSHLAIKDSYYNETKTFIEKKYDLLGQNNFYAVYKKRDLDSILQVVISNLPFNNDNALAAIARKLGLDQSVIDEMNQNYQVVEDELASMGGQINRHEHAFHAQFYFLSDKQKQKLKLYANLIQKKAGQESFNNITIQSMHLFKWIYTLCENFKHIVSQLDQLTQELEEPRISEPANTSNKKVGEQIQQTEKTEKSDNKKQLPPKEELRELRLAAFAAYQARTSAPKAANSNPDETKPTVAKNTTR